MKIKIRTAQKQKHHDLIVPIAKESKYTRDYTNMIFSGEDCYNDGRIRIAVVGTKVVGFSCVRLRKRDNVLVLYFIGVTESRRNNGIGERLIEDLQGLWGTDIELKVMKDNPAVRLYKRLGFKIVSEEAYGGSAFVMRLE